MRKSDRFLLYGIALSSILYYRYLNFLDYSLLLFYILTLILFILRVYLYLTELSYSYQSKILKLKNLWFSYLFSYHHLWSLFLEVSFNILFCSLRDMVYTS